MSYDIALRNHALRCLHRDMEFAPGAVQHGDDWIAFTVFDVACRIDLQNASAGRLWAMAGSHVKPTVALLRELNAWNARMHRAKVFVDEDRDVLVVADFRTESLEHEELGELVLSVVDCARRLAPMLDVVYPKTVQTETHEEIDR